MDTNLILMIVIAIFIVLTVIYSTTQPSRRNEKRQYLIDKASKLKTLSQKPLSDSEVRDIIVQLDSVLAKSLQIKLYNTAGCGENLKTMKGKTSNDMYEAIWKAHKLRNSIVHEGATPTDSQFAKSVNAFYQYIVKILG